MLENFSLCPWCLNLNISVSLKKGRRKTDQTQVVYALMVRSGPAPSRWLVHEAGTWQWASLRLGPERSPHKAASLQPPP